MPMTRVNDPGDGAVRPAPQQGRARPQQQGDDGADGGGEQADADAERQARQGAGQHVPAHPVGAKEELAAGARFLRVKSVTMARSDSSMPAAVTAHSRARGEDQQGQGGLPAVEASHALAAPLLILGSTTP